MVTTTRIRSGFDVELQLGRGWVLTALQTLATEGLLLTPPPPLPPDADVAVADVAVVFEPDGWDLKVDLVIGGLPYSALAGIELSADGAELVVTNDSTADVSTIPFDVLDGLAGVPTLVKLRGDAAHEPCFAVLANLDLRASPQSADPLPEGEHVARGEALLAQSFLPAGTDVAVGIGQATFPRFANDIWHTDLRAADGSHPLPDAENKIGTWHAASSAPEPGGIRMTLVGEVPIDVWPDATVTVDVYLRPQVVDGAITFSLDWTPTSTPGCSATSSAASSGGSSGWSWGCSPEARYCLQSVPDSSPGCSQWSSWRPWRAGSSGEGSSRPSTGSRCRRCWAATTGSWSRRSPPATTTGSRSACCTRFPDR
ncbi:MAG: hypothetical protein GEV09_10670 [Pseudonocardiaceae bacterium]|nr:hypothetical protein [Pseudonocardiaceae bacterium]